MKSSRRLVLASLLALGAVSQYACSAARSRAPEPSDPTIDAASLDAVGALVVLGPERGADAPQAVADDVAKGIGVTKDGREFYVLCTGALIGKTTVLTAEHCIAQGTDYELAFAIGADPLHPKRVVPIVATEIEDTVPSSGEGSNGSDVAIAVLGERVEDVAPLRPATLTEGDVGETFAAIGYAARGDHGTRRAGVVTVRARSGLLPESTENLIEGYEALAGAPAGDTQPCHGDSGAPLVRGGNVYGVASYALAASGATDCRSGLVYSTLGPAAQKMVLGQLACDAMSGADRASCTSR